MNAITQYPDIKTTDQFFPTNFPEIDKEISMIKTQTRELRSPDQCAMMISYFKDHKIRTDLTRSQSTLVTILLSMNVCRHIEGLFEASRHNHQFSTGFENYLLKELAL